MQILQERHDVTAPNFCPIATDVACSVITGYNWPWYLMKENKKSIPFYGIVRQHSTKNATDQNVIVIIQSYELEYKPGTG